MHMNIKSKEMTRINWITRYAMGATNTTYQNVSQEYIDKPKRSPNSPHKNSKHTSKDRRAPRKAHKLVPTFIKDALASKQHLAARGNLLAL